MCTVPSGEGKDSLCTVPSGEGKDSLHKISHTSGRQTQAFSYPVGTSRGPPVYTHSTQGRLQTAFQRTPKPVQGALHHQRLRRLRQTKCLLTSIQDLLHKGAIEVVHTQNSIGFYSRLFLVPKPGNRWRPVIDLSSLNKFLVISKFKMETPELIRASLRKGEWVTSIDLTDAYLHVPIHTHSQKYLRFHHKGVTYQFVSLPFGLATAPLVFTSLVKEVKLLALQQGIRLHQYLDDWLIRAPSKEECHSQTQALLSLVKDLGFVVNLKKSELRPSQRFDFLGYHFLLDLALVRPTQDRWTKLQEMFHRLSKKSVISARTLMSTIGLLASTEKTVKLGRMHMRPFQWHLKNHWKYPMPLDTPVPWNQKMIRHGEWWLDQQNVLQGEFLHPREHEKLIFTDASNAGWGAHSGQDSTGGLWSHLEKHLHINLLEMKAVFLALQFFKKTCQNNQVLIASDNTSVVAYINKQGGTRSAELCALMWRILTWCNQNNVTLHPGITQRNSGRPLQEEPDPINRMVPLSTNLQTNFQTLGESPSGPIRNQPEHKTPSLRLSNSRPSGMGCGCPEHSMGKPGCVRFPPHRPAAQGCTKTPIPDLQDNSHRPRLADKIMVLGSSGDVSGHTKTTTTHSHSAQTATEQKIPCKPSLPQSPRVVSRCSALKERGFTAEVAERIAAPQRLSTRAIYSSKWTVFQKWCTEEQVDFRNPSISDICNFFWYLFNVLNRCPSTIEGYRTAIADTLGNTKQNISNNVDIARLIASFYRDKPKSSRNIPKWNLSIILHTLSQPPFEPQEQADLKFLTWKVVFLLALASGKRRSEIHTWTLDGLLCLGDWEQVQLVPSPLPSPFLWYPLHCQKSISKGRTAINFPSGNSHLEVQPRLQGHRYPPLPYQGPQVLPGQNQRLKRE